MGDTSSGARKQDLTPRKSELPTGKKKGPACLMLSTRVLEATSKELVVRKEAHSGWSKVIPCMGNLVRDDPGNNIRPRWRKKLSMKGTSSDQANL